MRTEIGRWTYRFDRALRSPGALRPRDPGNSLAVMREY